jgi:hypothetical protein
VEEVTTSLLGARMYRRLHDGGSLWFDDWFVDVSAAAATAVRSGLRGEGDWRAPYRLLHGLASIGTARLARYPEAHLARLRGDVARHADPAEPEWLARVAQRTPTGRVWRLQDATGGRLGVIAEFVYSGIGDRSAYLFDIDVCGFDTLVGAGAYDHEEEAAAQWRERCGGTADGAVLTSVDGGGDLSSLVYLAVGREYLIGNESRSVMDNWFRARRRLDDLAAVLQRLDRPLPRERSLYQDLPVEPAVAEFTAWYRSRRGVDPDLEAAEALAGEWLEGIVPGTERVATAHRAAHMLALMSDWMDDAVTLEARTLLPAWVRWNAEVSGLPDPLVEAAVTVASGQPRRSTDCPGVP